MSGESLVMLFQKLVLQSVGEPSKFEFRREIKQHGKMSGESLVIITSGDGQMFEVDEAVACESMTIKNVLEDTQGSIIRLPNVPAKPLAKVLEYCQYHVELRERSEKGEVVPNDVVKQWDAKFINVSPESLADLIAAADYLNTKNLLELACSAVVNMIAGVKCPVEMRKIFKIKNDFTPEEEEGITRQDQFIMNLIRKVLDVLIRKVP